MGIEETTIVLVVVVEAQEMNFKTLGCCGVSQPRRKMRRRVEAQEKERNMEDPLVVGENN
jgi:hypothetical protein